MLAYIGQHRLRVPPLAERKCDILPLVLQGLDEEDAIRQGVRHISYTAHDFLHWYDWPENVRELGNKIQDIVGLTMASPNPDTITFEGIRQCFPDSQLSPREFAEACGEEFRDPDDSDLANLMRKTWDPLQEHRWERVKHEWRNPVVARYLRSLVCDEYEDVHLREVRPRLQPFHLIPSGRDSTWLKRTLRDHPLVEVYAYPAAEWLVDGASWNHKYDNEGYVFREDADSRILFDLEKMRKYLGNILPSKSTISSRPQRRGEPFWYPPDAKVGKLHDVPATEQTKELSPPKKVSAADEVDVQAREDTAENVFRIDGEACRIRFQGQSLPALQITNGLWFICQLLQNPHKAIQAIQLVQSLKTHQLPRYPRKFLPMVDLESASGGSAPSVFGATSVRKVRPTRRRWQIYRPSRITE